MHGASGGKLQTAVSITMHLLIRKTQGRQMLTVRALTGREISELTKNEFIELYTHVIQSGVMIRVELRSLIIRRFKQNPPARIPRMTSSEIP